MSFLINELIAVNGVRFGRVSVRVRVCVYVRVWCVCFMCAYTCVCLCVYICDLYVCFVCAYIRVYVCVCVYLYVLCVCIYVCMFVCVFSCACIRVIVVEDNS